MQKETNDIQPECQGVDKCKWRERFADKICDTCGAFDDNLYTGGDIGVAYDEPLTIKSIDN